MGIPEMGLEKPRQEGTQKKHMGPQEPQLELQLALPAPLGGHLKDRLPAPAKEASQDCVAQGEAHHRLVDVRPEGPPQPRGHHIHHELGHHIVGQEVVGKLQGLSPQGGHAEEQKGQGCSQVHHPGKPVKKVIYGGEVVEPLGPAEAALKEGIGHLQGLHRPLGPALSLPEIALEVLRGQPCRKHPVQVAGAPPPGAELQAGVQVLREGLGRESPQLLEGRPPEQPSGARKEGAPGGVPAGLDGPEEQVLLVAYLPLKEKGLLKDVRVVEVMRALHEGHPGLLEEAHQVPEECPYGHMVYIQDGHQLTPGPLQGIVQVAGLSVAPLGPVVPVAAQALGQGPDLGPSGIVQHMHLEAPPGVVLRQGPHQGALQNLQGLIHHRDEDVHRGVVLKGWGTAPEGPPGLEDEEEVLKQAVKLRQEEPPGNEHPLEGAQLQGLHSPPVKIPQLKEHCQEHHRPSGLEGPE